MKSLGALPGGTFSLTDAGGVSADGRVLAGTGLHNGSEEAWLVDLDGPLSGRARVVPPRRSP